MPHTTPADARRAASLILLRDGERGLEVLMLRRAERDGDLRSGAAVFPGGVLDARDAAAHALVHGAGDADWSQRLSLPTGGLDYAIAALRETFEEVGLLLAREASGQPVAPATASVLAPWRDRLQNGEVAVAELCQAADLMLDVSGLVYFSHWLTPPGAPKRFDTRFFVCAAPAGQEALADLGEAVELMWLTPAEALAPERGLKLLPVTQRTLMELGQHASTAAVLAAAHAKADIALVMPRRALRAGKPVVVLPHELPYAEISRLDAEGRGDVAADLLPGRTVALSPRIRRITAPNPGPMTGPGTNSYLVGGGTRWVVIDPGPAIDAHVQSLLEALAAMQATLSHILVTHTHRDHSPAAARLTELTGAPVWGCTAAHPMWQDKSFRADHAPADGERLVVANGVTLRAVHTPGHASNHVCWWLEEEDLLFTGDHVMQGSTVVINPPDGDMAAYLASLAALRNAPPQWLAPGHGFLVDQPRQVLDGLIRHRLKREAKVLAALASAAAPLDELVQRVYDDVPAALHGVAQRSLLAHLLKLAGEGRANEVGGGWARSEADSSP